jgi:hypothetical protein
MNLTYYTSSTKKCHYQLPTVTQNCAFTNRLVCRSRSSMGCDLTYQITIRRHNPDDHDFIACLHNVGSISRRKSGEKKNVLESRAFVYRCIVALNMEEEGHYFEGCGREGPLRCIFLCEFHPTAGPKITCQVRMDGFRGIVCDRLNFCGIMISHCYF